MALLLCVVVSLLAVGCSKESGQDRTQEPPTENPTPDNPKPDEPKPDDGDDNGDDNGDNEGGDTTDGDELHLLAFGSPYSDITRAPAGYTTYAPSSMASIGIFMTPENTTTPGYFLWDGTQWSSTVSVKSGTSYYIYGFAPGDAAKTVSVSKLAGQDTYAEGVTLTFTELKPIGNKDFCVITGVQGVTTSTAPEDVHLGRFAYAGQAEGQNYVYLLMDHFYACLQVRMSVNATYGELRTIKLKRMEMTTGATTANAVVSLTANDTGANPISNITWSRGSGTTTTVTLFESTDGEALPEGGSAKVIEGQLLPAIGADVTLVSTYDVYDKGGNLIRKDCTATNLLPASLGYKTLAPGDRLPVNLTVNPTYIYMLSDPDLDNPSVTVN